MGKRAAIGTLAVGFLTVAAATALARLDPTRPMEFKPRAAVAEGTRSLPRLTSILIGERRRVAVIDGQLAAVGESVAGATVREIAPTHVVVGMGEPEERVVLRLDRAEIVKESR